MTLVLRPLGAVQVYAADGAGGIDRWLGSGMRVADDVVLVKGRLADRLAGEVAAAGADGPSGLWVALRSAAGDEVTLVDVETVHVAAPENVARFHRMISAGPDSTVVALELALDPDAVDRNTVRRAAAVPETAALRRAPSGAGLGPGDPPPALAAANVICLLFGRLLRICRP